MKKITYFIIALIGFTFLFSCEKVTKDPVLDMSKATKAVFISPANDSAFVLMQDMADSTLAVFKWAAAKYNLGDLQSTTYSLQMDLADSNFVHSKELVSTTATEFSITVGAMNDKLISMGLVAEVTDTVQFRILSFLNTETTYSQIYSQPISLIFTPYSGVISYPKLYVPGDYQGWNPAAAPNVFDFNNDGIYSGYIYFPEGGTFQFKFTSDPDWDHTNYGLGASEFALSTDPAAGNLVVPGAGGYMLEVDINNLTWNYGTGVQNWSVIGEWLAWNADADMVYDITKQELSVTVADIPAAANQRFKFRANHAWTVNFGANTPDDGTLVQGGADIPIPDGGTLTFILRFTTPVPTYEVIKN